MRVLILLLMIASACSRTETPEPTDKASGPVAEAPSQPADDPPPPPPPGVEALPELEVDPTLELVDAGQAPKKALRTPLEAGDKRSIRIRSGWTLETMYGPMVKTTAVMPSLAYELTTEVNEAAEQGAEVSFRVKNITVAAGEDVKPAKVKNVEKAATRLKGAKGTFSIDAHGIVERFSIDAPTDDALLLSDMVDQIRQAIRASSLPLPQEPIGKGAKWTVTQTIEQRTAKITQTSAFELVKMQGDRVEVKAEHTAAAPEQVLKFPGSRSGATFGLDKVELAGSREGTWTLGKLGPSSASDQTGTVLIMTASAPKREIVFMGVDAQLAMEAAR